MPNPNIQDIIFANKQIDIPYSSINILQIAEEIIYKSKGNKVLLNYELNLTDSLEESFDDEFKTTYFHENMRVSQIRRVIAIMMMRKQEISNERMTFFNKILKSTK